MLRFLPALALVLLAAAPAHAQRTGEAQTFSALTATPAPEGLVLGDGAEFGASATRLGDLDGDGIADVAIGAPGDGPDDSNDGPDGVVHILLMNADGTARRVHRIRARDVYDDLDATFFFDFGRSVASIGDLDGDARAELAVGSAGAARLAVLFLNADGSLREAARWDAAAMEVPGYAFESEDFGVSLAGVGDVDGDGAPDLAVGTPGRTRNGGFSPPLAGSATVFFLNPDGTPRAAQRLATDAGLPSGEAVPDFLRFGETLAPLGDMDGDGTPDLAIGAPSYAFRVEGAVYLVTLSADGTAKTLAPISRGDAGVPQATRLSTFGKSLAAPGDLDGDGTRDLLVGTPAGETLVGRADVLFLNPDATVRATRVLDDDAGLPASTDLANQLTGNTSPAAPAFGASLAALGDLDGDGAPDWLVGAPLDFDDADGSYSGGRLAIRRGAGAAYVLFGADPSGAAPGTAARAQKLSDVTGSPAGFELDEDDFFGNSAVTIGDLDGDGIPEIALGATGDDDTSTGQPDHGAVYILFLDADGKARRIQKLSEREGLPDGFAFAASTFGADFGRSLAALGDVDGDGIPDLAVGASRAEVQGRVYVALLRTDGTAKSISAFPPPADITSGTPRFGSALTPVGDLDGDGVPDLAVGASGFFGSGFASGAVYVAFMEPGDTVRRYVRLDTDALFAGGDQGGTALAALAPAGGGAVRLAVGATGSDALASNAGDVLLLDLSYLAGSDSVAVTASRSLAPSLPAALQPQSQDGLGRSLTALGDFDGDGAPDLAIGTEAAGNNAGAVTLVFLDAGGALKLAQPLLGPGAPYAPAPGETFGAALATTPDLDGDERIELLVGASNAFVEFGGQGKAMLFYLDAAGTVTVGRERAEVAVSELGSPYPNPALGSAVHVPYRLAEASTVRIALYDALGREVRVQRYTSALGEHTATLRLGGLAAGLYLVRLEASGARQTRRVVVVR